MERAASRDGSPLELLSEMYDLLVPDHPTYGLSDEPEWLDSMDDLAMFYFDFFEQMDLSGVHLVGNSLGGWLAMEIAVNCSRLKSLTLVGSADSYRWKPIADTLWIQMIWCVKFMLISR